MEEYQEYSLRGRVFQKIRDGILKGEYKENEELRESTIGKKLGVSRTPVREALRQLELEGLVKIVPNKGAYVTGITGKDVKDIYLLPPGRTLRQMGDRAYYRRTDRKTRRDCFTLRISCKQKSKRKIGSGCRT